MRVRLLAHAGSGPPLVYVPGIDGSGELLLGTARRLEERFHLLRLCYEPEGEVDSLTDLSALARSLVRVLAEQELERVLLLAESFGVALALQTALLEPARVRGLALVNGFAHYPQRLRLAGSRLGSAFVSRHLFLLGRKLFAERILFRPRHDAAALAAFRALELRGMDDAYRARLRLIQRLDLRPELGRIACPVALFASDHDRVVPALTAARDLLVRLPDATLEVLPRANHLVLPLAEEPWLERLLDLQRRAQDAGQPAAAPRMTGECVG